MYRDDECKINPKWPQELLDELAEADRLYDAAIEAQGTGNRYPEGEFLLYMLGVEPSVKSWYIAGKISEEDVDVIFRRYGWR